MNVGYFIRETTDIETSESLGKTKVLTLITPDFREELKIFFDDEGKERLIKALKELK